MSENSKKKNEENVNIIEALTLDLNKNEAKLNSYEK